MNHSSTIFAIGLFTILSLVLSPGKLSAQSTANIEPPVQASTNSTQAIMSPDPDALPVFRFATAELNEDGNVTIATKQSTQTLVAPMPKTPSAELDPKGIRYTENMSQTYTVAIPYTETDEDGNTKTKMRHETRTRTIPVTRYRKRNAEQQAEFEKRVAEEKEKQEESDDAKVKPAVSTNVTQEYTVNVPFSVDVDGETVTRTRSETRKSTVVVFRGKTETKSTLNKKTLPVDKLKCYDIDGVELDVETIKLRLTERQPVILVTSVEGITPFFRALLNPEATFIITPEEE